MCEGDQAQHFSRNFMRPFILLISIFVLTCPAYAAGLQRDIFRPLWKTSDSPSEISSKPMKAELDAIRKAEEERVEAQRKQEDQRRLEEKKKDIENSYTVTGIIHENGNLTAVLQSKRSSGKNYFVTKGETVDELKVTAINESRGDVTLDYDNKVSVTLHME